MALFPRELGSEPSTLVADRPQDMHRVPSSLLRTPRTRFPSTAYRRPRLETPESSRDPDSNLSPQRLFDGPIGVFSPRTAAGTYTPAELRLTSPRAARKSRGSDAGAPPKSTAAASVGCACTASSTARCPRRKDGAELTARGRRCRGSRAKSLRLPSRHRGFS